MEINLQYIILSLQTALLGSVEACLRAIVIDLDQEKKELKISFFYDTDITDHLLDISSTIIAEITLPWGYVINDKIVKLTYPENIPNEGVLVYYRKEPKVLANIQKNYELIKCDYPKKYFSAHLRCVMQKALLGYITSNIRQISIEWMDELIYVHFYYNTQIVIEDHSNMYNICKNLFEELPYCIIRLLSFTIKEPIYLPQHKELIYLRYEKNYGQEPLFIPSDKK